MTSVGVSPILATAHVQSLSLHILTFACNMNTFTAFATCAIIKRTKHKTGLVSQSVAPSSSAQRAALPLLYSPYSLYDGVTLSEMISMWMFRFNIIRGVGDPSLLQLHDRACSGPPTHFDSYLRQPHEPQHPVLQASPLQWLGYQKLRIC